MKSGTNFPQGGSSFNSGDIIRQSKFDFGVPNVFRVLGLCVPFKQVFYPALRLNRETGALEQGFWSVRLPFDCPDYGWTKEPTIVDDLIRLDLDIRTKHRPVASAGKIESKFSPGSRWVFAVFDRSEPKPVVKQLEVSWSVYDKIKKLQSKPSEKNKDMLLHGPVFVHDIVITKEKKDDKRRGGRQAYNVSYEVRSAQDNPFAGKIDKSILEEEHKADLDALIAAAVEFGIYTEEEQFVIDSFDENEIINRLAPNTPEEILRAFAENPICLDAQDDDGHAIFPHLQEYMSGLADIECQFGLLDSTGASETKQLPAPKEEPLKREMEVKQEPEKPDVKPVEAKTEVKMTAKTATDDSKLPLWMRDLKKAK